jgi:hypothetical protein
MSYKINLFNDHISLSSAKTTVKFLYPVIPYHTFFLTSWYLLEKKLRKEDSWVQFCGEFCFLFCFQLGRKCFAKKQEELDKLKAPSLIIFPHIKLLSHYFLIRSVFLIY